MRVTYRTSFGRDLKRIRQRTINERIEKAIVNVKQAVAWTDIQDIKKLANSANAFRIRVDTYRIGVVIEDDTVHFVRVLPRSEIYRKFP